MFSKDLYDLINRMLNTDPISRITANEVFLSSIRFSITHGLKVLLRLHYWKKLRELSLLISTEKKQQLHLIKATKKLKTYSEAIKSSIKLAKKISKWNSELVKIPLKNWTKLALIEKSQNNLVNFTIMIKIQ